MTLNSHNESPQSAGGWIEQPGREFGAQVFTICFAITNDLETARQATAHTFTAAIRHHRLTGQTPDEKWLSAQSVKESRKLAKSPAPSPQRPGASGEVEDRIWHLLEAFGWQERLLCAAHFGLKWSDERTAGLLGVETAAVRRQIGIFERLFDKILSDLPGEIAQDRNPRQLAAEALEKYYAPPAWSAQEFSDLMAAASSQADLAPGSIQRRLAGRWILLAVGGVLLAGFCVVAGYLAFRTILPARNQPASQPQATSLAAASSSRRRYENPLRWFSSSNAIRRRMGESADLWKTLFVEIQGVDYGPEGYIGAPRIYGAQAWVSQPDQSIQLFGLLGGGPSSAYMLSDGRDYYLNPVTDIAYSRPRLASPESLIENRVLRQMVFPAVSPWGGDTGTVRVFNTGEVAGLSALVVDWFNPYGEKQARLWLEVNTGLVLRVQEFGGQDYDLLLRDTAVTTIAFDENFPPAQLAAAVSQVGSSSPYVQPQPGQVILPTPTPAVPAYERTAIPPDPAPTSLDRSAARLTFQFPNNLETSSLVTGTAQVPTQLFADGRWIAEIRFGLPWMLRCDRSADGYRLAFNTGSDGTSVADDSLRWFDLREPEKIYNPLANLHVDEFAFTQDGNRMAVLGRPNLGEPYGVYLLEVLTGESKQIFALYQGSNLTWSPDEEFLGLVGALEPDEQPGALLIHVRTGQVAFEAPLPQTGEELPTDWPMANWGVVFPAEMGGMQQCLSRAVP